MATSDDVDRFLKTWVREGFAVEVPADAKQSLAHLMEWYGGAGYSEEDLAKQIEARTATSELGSTSPDDFSSAVTALATGTQGGHENTSVVAESVDTEDPQMMAVLASELAADVMEHLEDAKKDWMAALTAELWKDVRANIESEISSNPEVWASDAGREAIRDAAYYALIDAADGLCDQIEAEGGYVAILTRADS